MQAGFWTLQTLQSRSLENRDENIQRVEQFCSLYIVKNPFVFRFGTHKTLEMRHERAVGLRLLGCNVDNVWISVCTSVYTQRTMCKVCVVWPDTKWSWWKTWPAASCPSRWKRTQRGGNNVAVRREKELTTGKTSLPLLVEFSGRKFK